MYLFADSLVYLFADSLMYLFADSLMYLFADSLGGGTLLLQDLDYCSSRLSE